MAGQTPCFGDNAAVFLRFDLLFLTSCAARLGGMAWKLLKREGTCFEAWQGWATPRVRETQETSGGGGEEDEGREDGNDEKETVSD